MKSRLPDGELVVMQAVWDCPPPVTAAKLHQVLQQEHPMAQTTLLTLLSRLAERGFLEIQKEGRSNVYISKIQRHDYQAGQSRRFLDSLFGGSISAFASALCDGGLTREELTELKALLEEDEP